MAPPYHFVAYSCLHFDILTASDSPEQSNASSEPDSTITGLWFKPTTSQHIMTSTCGHPGCDNLTTNDLAERIHEALQDCREYFALQSEGLVNFGTLYHLHSFWKHAKTAGDPAFQILHTLYAIESRPWTEDPFFKKWRTVSELMKSVEAIEDLETSQDSCASAANKINQLRALMGQVEKEMGKLICPEVLAELAPKKGRERLPKNFKVLRNGVIVAEAARVAEERWKTRIVGFGKCFDKEKQTTSELISE